jgi:uncharacterized membrane protein YhaH (DUF805 family)
MDGIDWGWLFFQFEGRINRAKYWLGLVLLWAVLSIAAIVAIAVDSAAFWVLYSILAVAVIWPYLAIAIKRWHDRGKSGWWVLIGLIPLIGGIWVLVECGFLPGDDGPNEYGPDPLAMA